MKFYHDPHSPHRGPIYSHLQSNLEQVSGPLLLTQGEDKFEDLMVGKPVYPNSLRKIEKLLRDHRMEVMAMGSQFIGSVYVVMLGDETEKHPNDLYQSLAFFDPIEYIHTFNIANLRVEQNKRGQWISLPVRPGSGPFEVLKDFLDILEDLQERGPFRFFKGTLHDENIFGAVYNR